MIDPARLGKGWQDFQPRSGERELQCEVQPIKPVLNFGFRFQAGYIVRVPMSQFLGAGHSWVVVFRVTPKSGDRKPVYLAGAAKLPEVPRTTIKLEFAGSYLLGTGEYSVDWLLIDDSDRVCRKQWRVEAKPNRGERNLQLAIAPDTVSDIWVRQPVPVRRAGSDPATPRITVLLHAAPLSPSRVRLRTYDRFLLLSSLASLVERLPQVVFRVVAFNLDQQKELFRQDRFERSGFDQIARALGSLELGSVDYNVLKNPQGHIDLLADLVNEELRSTDPPDAVVVLGPTARQSDKVPRSALGESQEGAPRFFYFQYKPYWFRSATFPDTITFAMKRLGGKIAIIRTPAEFGKAIEQVKDVLPGRGSVTRRSARRRGPSY